jgi:putative membrane protein
MGGMMSTGGTAGFWILLASLLGLVMAVTGGIIAARAVVSRHRADQERICASQSPALRQARDALRLRYANGDISREDYLQGKVELED